MSYRHARRLALSASGHPGSVRVLSGALVNASALEEGVKSTWVTLTRMGEFSDPRYGKFAITRDMLLAMVRNFEARVYGQDIAIDVAHNPDAGAAAFIRELRVEGQRLRASVEWTPYGIQSVRERGYRYLSVEYHEDWADNEQGAKHGPTLLGAGLTLRPVIKHLDPVMLAESADDTPLLIHPEFARTLATEQTMFTEALLKALKEKLEALKLSEPVIDALIASARKALAQETSEERAKVLAEAFHTSGVKLSELGAPTGPIEIKIAAGATGLNEEQVKKMLAEERARFDAASKKLAEDLTAKRKLLSDTIARAEGVPDAMKKELAESVVDLVSAEMSDEQVVKLAAAQIASGNKIIAAQKLAELGYNRGPAGHVHITVDDSNTVKALQESVDKRLGYDRMSASRRFARTGGALPEANKELAEAVLAQYDALNVQRLHAEHKQLAAGSGVVSDVAIPAAFERTVIREALYQLIGPQFVNVGTAIFSQTVGIPYSYRDTTAAGMTSSRRYERQGIANAGVTQVMDQAYPIPQKLAFSVSDEVRYLTANGQIDFDATAENVRNAARIIGEDTEQLIFNEIVDAADQYLPAAISGEVLTAAVNGTNTIFPLAQWPVLRPKSIFDLQGNLVGSVLYPITVTIGGVSRPMYDGSNTQSAGNYWRMAYNRGELQIVNQLGAPVALTAATALLISYSYGTNVFKFNVDNGATAIDDYWNTFIYRYGLRKSVIEDERYYMANFGLMSGTVKNQIEQAKQWAANFTKPGSSLDAEGNLGVIKGVPNFKSTAPGLLMGDERVIIGERGITRYRMLKPWAMNEMEPERNSTGQFTGAKSAYGDQFCVVHTPTPLKRAYTSIVLHSAAARVARAS
jgi:hypothetical protein